MADLNLYQLNLCKLYLFYRSYDTIMVFKKKTHSLTFNWPKLKVKFQIIEYNCQELGKDENQPFAKTIPKSMPF